MKLSTYAIVAFGAGRLVPSECQKRPGFDCARIARFIVSLAQSRRGRDVVKGWGYRLRVVRGSGLDVWAQRDKGENRLDSWTDGQMT
jgi:hypothetical protein